MIEILGNTPVDTLRLRIVQMACPDITLGKALRAAAKLSEKARDSNNRMERVLKTIERKTTWPCI